MPEPIPQVINWMFIGTTALTGYFFLQANAKRKWIALSMIVWLFIQVVLSEKGFYLDSTSVPPRLIVAVLPPLLLIIACFTTPRGRRYLDALNPYYLTWLHVVRVPVEIVLYLLMIHQLVPAIMTFEGRNFDIFSGITAPIIAALGYRRQKLPGSVLIAWNIICLGLLFNVVYYGVLSAPTVFQRYAFDQPNTAVLHFPFVWLPSFIVPLVLFSHLVCLRQLFRSSR